MCADSRTPKRRASIQTNRKGETMASVRITINTDGAAFQPAEYDNGWLKSQEVGRILKTLAEAFWRESSSLKSATLSDLLHDDTVGTVEMID